MVARIHLQLLYTLSDKFLPMSFMQDGSLNYFHLLRIGFAGI